MPEELCDIHSLQSCHLEGNQFSFVPPCVAERCTVRDSWGNATRFVVGVIHVVGALK